MRWGTRGSVTTACPSAASVGASTTARMTASSTVSSPSLAAAFKAHLERLRVGGHATGLDDHVIQNTRGGRVTRQRVAAIVREAAEAATEARAREGLPPLPRTTPHSLRRTYISIALRANNYDVKWVMSQVGHADSKMTLDVYAQLEHRAKRDHGARFDELAEGPDDQCSEKTTGDGPPERQPERAVAQLVRARIQPTTSSCSASPA